MENRSEFDAIIIGGGPAGISAALWCADLGFSCVVLEKADVLYGQLNWIHNPIGNYPGIPARNGEEMIAHFERSAASAGVKWETRVSLDNVDCERKLIYLADGRCFSSGAIFIATGVRRRKLDVPGEMEFRGKGVLESGAGEKESVRGGRVVVVGGGDAAAENALLLAEYAESVYLVHRGAELSARPEFQDRIAGNPKITLFLEAEVKEIGGGDRLEHVDVTSKADGRKHRLEAGHFISRIGFAPNSEAFADQVDCDGRGYITVDTQCRTNITGVYAIGDVASPVSPTIATAVGMGSTAVKGAFRLLTSPKTV